MPPVRFLEWVASPHAASGHPNIPNIMTAPSVSIDFFRRIVPGIILFLAAFAPAASAADNVKRSYDIPAGDAAATLRQFGDASGREILFAAEIVRGVRTQPVRGDFNAAEALDRMLVGTKLHAQSDERTGTWAIRMRPESTVSTSSAPA